MSRVAQMALLAGKIAPAVLTQQAALNNATSTTNVVTTAAQAIGPAAADRTVFAIVHWFSPSPAKALASATIGGIAAAIHVQNSGNIGSFYAGVAIISAQVPTGTTAVVVLTYASGVNFNVNLTTYRCTGLLSQIATDIALSLTIGFSSHTDNIDVTKDGILLSGISIFWNSTSTLTGVTRDYNAASPNSNFYYEGGSLGVTADQTNRPIQVSVSGSTNALMVSAAFR